MATIEEIKTLRDQTGAGINSVREALKESGGDAEKALQYLRKKGVAKSDKRKDKTAGEGVVGKYIHNNNKVAVLVEINCETDFAARSEDLVKLANDLAIHIAATSTKYLDVNGIPEKELTEAKETFEKDLEGKPEGVRENILAGKLEKFYQDNVLLKQKLFTDDSKTVEEALTDVVAKIGEKIVINRLVKMEVAKETVVSTAS
jgi:elongation factor Ts